MYRIGLVLIVVAVLPIAACDDSIVGSGRDGEARAVVTSAADGPGAPEGTVTVHATVMLVTDAGEEVKITDGIAAADAQIEGTDSSLVAQAAVPPATYVLARVEFAEVEAFVTGGLSVDGVPFLGSASVDTGAGGIIIESPIEMTVGLATSETLVIDLNASQWLPSVDFPTGRVPAADFRNAVELRVR